MTTWNYRVFREEDGDYLIREVFYDNDGRILGCTEDAVTPFGQSIDELAQNIEWFKEALDLPVLTVAEVDVAIQEEIVRAASRPRKTISHAELLVKLGLDTDEPAETTELSVAGQRN